MTALPWHPSQGIPHPSEAAATVIAAPADDLIRTASGRLACRPADCCAATAAYRVVLPVGAGRLRPAELLLCTEHYAVSAARLATARAAVFDADAVLVASAR